jgi:hypothetical protein
MKLTALNVNTIFQSCLFKDGETINDACVVEGVVSKVEFHPRRVNNHRVEIEALLLELPDAFRNSNGGGWSFLQACDDRHGNQWTGLHRDMEELFQLGMAIGKVKCLMSRPMWQALPGGMPYYVVLDKEIGIST